MRQALHDYLRAVEREYKTGIAAEHAYRPALERLIESVGTGINAVNDPRRSAIGAPDFQVLRGQTTIGFVEAKDINKQLDQIERTDQMQRYMRGFNNLILTDYLEFRWYVRGERQQKVRIADANGRIRADQKQFDEMAFLLQNFAETITHTITTAQELARRMAANAHLIRDLIYNDLQSDDPSNVLTDQLEAFETTLLPGIDHAQFADMYAQTIAYGLFAARVNYPGDPTTFSRRGAGEDIPRTNPFLRKLFTTIGLDLGERVTFIVDTLADLLAHTDTASILKDFGRATRQEDPIVHFYETFLSEYDPKLREQRGVYYTPEPVVSYIVRSVDHVLKKQFGRPDGLADTNTLILDPATGTGTFLYFTIKHIYEEAFKGQGGIWDSYVQQHLLNRVFGFELLMAPYAVAHMKLGLLLEELGYNFSDSQRLGVYLTNTLEEATKKSEGLFAQFISQEANEAAAVKRDKPIIVVLGNPPYSGHSANKGEWISKLVRDYYQVDGNPLGERNPKWLQDDYVKFIRFGQWRIEQTGYGVLAFVTNHGYLDNPTFRGMRQQLMQAFTDIYIINLHGNSKKKERTPNGGPDQNVFDIQQGVAIGIFVKEQGKSGPARVHHVDLWGVRDEKYAALMEQGVDSSEWEIIEPRSPYYLFTPYDLDLWSEYELGWKVTDAIPLNSVGIVTGQDKKAIAFTAEEAQNLAITQKFPDNTITPVAYRPYDIRHIIYDSVAVTRTRKEVMHHVWKRKNLGLVTTRQQSQQSVWSLVSISSTLIESCYISNKTKEINSLFPLYLYPQQRENELFNLDDDGSDWPLSNKGRRPNLNPQFVQDVATGLGLDFITDGKGNLENTFGPEDIFAYAYAVLHSPTYRERYSEYLKIDFPRVPLTTDIQLFRALVEQGDRLIDLHLMRSTELNRLITTYPVVGSNEVAERGGYPKYTPEDQRVWINTEQYFEGVPENTWGFYIGGYQVLDKWLKDRRGRVLNYDDIRHYQRIVVALTLTDRIMQEIDELIPDWPIT